MARRLVVALVAVVLDSGPIGAEPRAPIRRDAQDVATLITRAHLSAEASEDPADRQLRLDLVNVQKLLRQTLADAIGARDSGALETLGAECRRLRPEILRRAQAASRVAEGWQRIDAAFSELCAKRDELATATDAASKGAIAAPLLERIEGTYDPTRAREAPTIRLPTPERASRP